MTNGAFILGKTSCLGRAALIGLSVLIVDGCSLTQPNPENVLEVNEGVEIRRDDFKGTLYYQGPVVSNRAEHGDDAPEVEDVRLHARTERDRPTRFFLNIIDYYEGDWRGFDQAYDTAGNKFHALIVRHEAKCQLLCGYEEILEVELSKAYLDAHRDSGIMMRLYGPSGTASAPFSIPAPYIQGFLKGAFES